MPRCLPMLRQLASDLERELARRREDQRLRLAVRRHQLVDERETERGRLAGAGARLDEEVLARADRLEHGGLHRRRCEVTHVVERVLDVGVEAEVIEARWLRRGGFSSFGDCQRWIRWSSVCIAASSAAASAAPFSVGVVSFVIERNLGELISPEIIQSGRWSGRGAWIRRNQATSLVAARRCVTEAELALHGSHPCSRALLLSRNGRHLCLSWARP